MFVQVGIYHISRSAKHLLKATLDCVPVRLYMIGTSAGVWVFEMATVVDGRVSSVADRPPTRPTIFPYLATTRILFYCVSTNLFFFVSFCCVYQWP